MTPAEQPKPWWQSRSIIGSVIVILSTLAGLLGWSVDSEATTEIALQVAALIGAALAIYGRIKADRPIRQVRKAIAVDGQKPRYKFPKTGGYYELPGAGAAFAWLLAVGLIFAVAAGMQTRATEEISWQEMMARRDAMLASQPAPEIRFCDVIDTRPFLARLLDSLTITPSLRGSTNATATLAPELYISGGTDF